MSLLAFLSDPIVLQSSQGLVTGLRNFIGPIFLLAAGIAALSFLFQRQITQFIIFLVLFVVIAAVFYAPEMLSNLGTSFGNSNQNW